MGREARVSQRSIKSYTQAAVDKVNELIPIVAAQGERISELSAQNADLIGVNKELQKRVAAQGEMILQAEKDIDGQRTHVIDLSKQERSYVDGELAQRDRRDSAILDRVEHLEQMTFFERFAWLFLGRVTIKTR